MKIQVVANEAAEGGYWAEVPAIPGCATHGETFEDSSRTCMKPRMVVLPYLSSHPIPPAATESWKSWHEELFGQAFCKASSAISLRQQDSRNLPSDCLSWILGTVYFLRTEDVMSLGRVLMRPGADQSLAENLVRKVSGRSRKMGMMPSNRWLQNDTLGTTRRERHE